MKSSIGISSGGTLSSFFSFFLSRSLMICSLLGSTFFFFLGSALIKHKAKLCETTYTYMLGIYNKTTMILVCQGYSPGKFHILLIFEQCLQQLDIENEPFSAQMLYTHFSFLIDCRTSCAHSLLIFSGT